MRPLSNQSFTPKLSQVDKGVNTKLNFSLAQNNRLLHDLIWELSNRNATPAQR